MMKKSYRLHYLDIRDHLQFLHVIKQLDNIIYPALKSLSDDNINDIDKYNKLQQIKHHIIDIKQYIMNIIENSFEIQKKK